MYSRQVKDLQEKLQMKKNLKSELENDFITLNEDFNNYLSGIIYTYMYICIRVYIYICIYACI